MVPKGPWHNATNIGGGPMKVYSLYTSPHHAPGTVHETRADDDR